MKPLVSIIIPVFNRASLILETLNSVKNQSYHNWECIIVDDGSTDTTKSVIEAYIANDTRFLLTERPKSRPSGGNAARNYGFEISKGDYIQWFDSDDVMHENLLELQLDNLLSTNKKLSICLFDRYNEDFSVLTKKAVPNVIKHGIYYDYITRVFKANLPTTLFESTLLKNYKLSERLLKAQELEFLQRIFRQHEADCVLLNQALVKVRRHNDSITIKGTSNKYSSVLDAYLIIFDELPSTVPVSVKKSIIKHYFGIYKIALINKNLKLYLKYGIKTFKFSILKGIQTNLYLYVVYVMSVSYTHLTLPTSDLV